VSGCWRAGCLAACTAAWLQRPPAPAGADHTQGLAGAAGARADQAPPARPPPRSYLLERGDVLLFVEDEEQEKQLLSVQEAYALMVRGGPGARPWRPPLVPASGAAPGAAAAARTQPWRAASQALAGGGAG
jgi:hypothetical protein